MNVTQVSTTRHRSYLAVKYLNGTYILNGLNNLQLYTIKLRIGNAKLIYSGSDSLNENVLIIGRLKMPVEIQVISVYQSGSPSSVVHWEYYFSSNENNLMRQYGDNSIDYYCDRPCQGFKLVKLCFINGIEYDSNYCVNSNTPFVYRKEQCNNHCVLSWTVKYQQVCSTRCGNGYKRVIYQCTKTTSIEEILDEDVCRQHVGEKPPDIISCIGDCSGTGWVYGNWSEVCLIHFSFRLNSEYFINF